MDPMKPIDIPNEIVDEEPVAEPKEDHDISLTEEQERRATEICINKTLKWLKANPNYTMDQLSEKKREFFKDACKKVASES